MTLIRRTLLQSLAASAVVTAMPQTARASTLGGHVPI
jgi:hypothetical protein